MEMAWGCVQREALVLLGAVPYIIQTFNLYPVTHCKIMMIIKNFSCVYFQTA